LYVFAVAKKETSSTLLGAAHHDATTIKPETSYRFKTRDPVAPPELNFGSLDRPLLGKAYEQGQMWQTITTQLARYSKANPTHPNVHYLEHLDSFTRIFATRFFRTHKPVPVTNELLAKHLKPVIEKFLEKGSHFQDLYIALCDRRQAFRIHFFLKRIIKASLSRCNAANKVGQGISAWPKQLNAVYCAIFRAIEERFRDVLLPHVLYENGNRMADIDAFVAKRFDGSLESFTNDFTCYDEHQDATTQLLEDAVLQLFMPSQYLWLYRQMRLRAKQTSKQLSLWNQGAKNSGESATLFTNTLVNMFVMALTTEVRGAKLEMYKGDDQVVNAVSIELRNMLADKNLEPPKFKSDLDYPLFPDFASYYLSPYGIIPDVAKILAKFLSKDHQARTEYFAELKTGLSDHRTFLSPEKWIFLRGAYSHVYGWDEHVCDMLLATFNWYTSSHSTASDQLVGFNALMANGNLREISMSDVQLNVKKSKQAPIRVKSLF
jgi:hypothetical protein